MKSRIEQLDKIAGLTLRAGIGAIIFMAAGQITIFAQSPRWVSVSLLFVGLVAMFGFLYGQIRYARIADPKK